MNVTGAFRSPKGHRGSPIVPNPDANAGTGGALEDTVVAGGEALALGVRVVYPRQPTAPPARLAQ